METAWYQGPIYYVQYKDQWGWHEALFRTREAMEAWAKEHKMDLVVPAGGLV